MMTEKPHLKIMAIQAPAKPIIEPIDKSNSPEIINKPAPIAMIPNWEITLKKFLIPKALKPSPVKGFQDISPAGMEKYPSMPKSRSITPIGPTSGLEINVLSQVFFWCLSDSCLLGVVELAIGLLFTIYLLKLFENKVGRKLPT